MTTTPHDPTERDPRFPDRPTHPDFYELSRQVQENDAYAEGGQAGFRERIAEFVDLDSLDYIAKVRSNIAYDNVADHPALIGLRGHITALVAGGIIDGFVLGAAYERARPSEADDE